ncbi:MAG TPA: adenylyltransferase/cytidyltransferase family protein [Bacteroidia bacterium]|jgi:rfaE bifunctional protein nucleotidyltransferase chain/domain|nr:adenylyltransferase/cytidyltransferase family protein [Bacteroidia bacterium]
MLTPRKTQLELIQSKIYTADSIRPMLLYWRFKDEKIVFTNGCFDIIHRGHIDYLCKAADCGTQLIIGLNSDDSVRRLQKGPSRPLQDEQSRALILAALHFVSAVVCFNEDTPYDLIKQIQPDVLVKGSDYKIEQIAGHDLVKEVKLIDFLPGYSTSGIERKIKG